MLNKHVRKRVRENEAYNNINNKYKISEHSVCGVTFIKEL